jgi:hypothetical protein
MADQSERPSPHGDPLEEMINNNSAENSAQHDSDAPPDGVAERGADRMSNADRAGGRGSTANGVPAFDEDDGEIRRKHYRSGAELVSRID